MDWRKCSCLAKNSMNCEKSICPANICQPPPPGPSRKRLILISQAEVVLAQHSMQLLKTNSCSNQPQDQWPDICGFKSPISHTKTVVTNVDMHSVNRLVDRQTCRHQASV